MFSNIITHRLVKSEDLNHHGTLFAGRCAEWFVENSFNAVAIKLKPNNIVCLKVHGFEFLQPIKLGTILKFESKIVAAGRSTVTVFTKAMRADQPDSAYCDGYVTFVHVDENTQSTPHGLVIVPETEDEKMLNETAKSLVLLVKQQKLTVS
ncbi:hypothetical protein FACS1894178_5070 [Bacteroidia bacterium]|nr:hypothetical protein FACS1894178_5070 [Bacteroidia bacterium]